MSQTIAPAPTLEDLSAELVLYTGRLVRAVTRLSAGVVDVPTASLRLLSQIDELGGVSVGALARADRCSQPTMSVGVHQLCERGWAQKRPHPSDARSSLVSLTDAGRSVLVDARRERAAVVADRLRADPHHDEDDLARAVAVLRGLLDEPARPDYTDHTDHTDDTEEGTA